MRFVMRFVMGVRANRLHAIALAGAVTALTPAALAQSLPSASTAEAVPVDGVPPSIAAIDKASAATSVPSAPEAGTPLALRPSKPLELAHEPPPSSLGWKLVAFAALLGGAAWYARKKLWVKPSEDGQLTIVRRATIGFRTELLVVNVEGQRLLLGVTPNSIQSLAVLDADEPSPAIAERPAVAPSFGDRFAAMLDAAENQSAPTARRAESASSPVAAAALGAYVASAPAEKPAPRARRARGGHGASAANATTTPANPPAPVPAADEEPEVGSQARGLLALQPRSARSR